MTWPHNLMSPLNINLFIHFVLLPSRYASLSVQQLISCETYLYYYENILHFNLRNSSLHIRFPTSFSNQVKMNMQVPLYQEVRNSVCTHSGLHCPYQFSIFKLVPGPNLNTKRCTQLTFKTLSIKSLEMKLLIFTLAQLLIQN